MTSHNVSETETVEAAEGLQLDGEGGLLQQLTKRLLSADAWGKKYAAIVRLRANAWGAGDGPGPRRPADPLTDC
jgi:hypothetical protein